MKEIDVSEFMQERYKNILKEIEKAMYRATYNADVVYISGKIVKNRFKDAASIPVNMTVFYTGLNTEGKLIQCLKETAKLRYNPLTSTHDGPCGPLPDYCYENKICECGTDKAGGGIHSDWCPKS